MSFTSIIFLFCFFPLSVLFYYVALWLEKKIPFLKKIRINSLILILISLVFYAWVLTINAIKFLIYITIIYIFGILISKYKKHSKLTLIIGLVFTIVVLLFYKYLGLVIKASWYNKIIVPIGISFITFSAISYLVDIYKKKAPSSNLVDAILYFVFFPKVISGPIVFWKDY